MELYSLLVFLKNNPNTIRFLFKSNTTAKAAYESFHSPATPNLAVDIRDDYGNAATIDRDSVAVYVQSYCNEDFNGQAEFSIMQAHANAKLQRRAATDPMLKTGVVAANGPLLRPPMQ